MAEFGQKATTITSTETGPTVFQLPCDPRLWQHSSDMSPRGSDRRTTTLLAFAFLVLLFNPVGTDAPVVMNLQDGRVLMLELTGSWRFHSGDDPRWSEPNLDDSVWATIGSDKIGSLQMAHNDRINWYRTRFASPFGTSRLALEMPPFSGSYEVFVNGARIGRLGRMPPKTHFEGGPSQVFEIPANPRGVDKMLCIAIRMLYLDTGNAVADPPRVGESAFIWKAHTLEMHDRFWRAGVASLQVPFELLGAVAGFVLFALSRSEREYLWYAIFQLIGATFDAYVVYMSGALFPATASRALLLLGNGLYDFFVLFFVLDILAVPKRWMYRIAVTAAILNVIVNPFRDALSAIGVMHDGAEVVLAITVILFLVVESRRKNRDAQLLLIPISLWYLSELAFLSFDWAGRLGGPQVVDIGLRTVDWPFPIDALNAMQVLSVVSLIGLLIFRFVRVRNANREIGREIEAARVVQRVLVPAEIPDVVGYAVDAVYRPAGQVGGDFFQVLPVKSGGALIVVGDVSGKGMPAAMAVSLLVGTLRTLAHYTQNPAEILSAMNQRMLARSKDGFTTCLVTRVGLDGSVRAANAGHLAPYVGGREAPMENGLPLGLVEDANYEEAQFQLGLGEQLTLMTDGVVEAQSKSRELFGFERAAALSRKPAEQIAQAAIAFGQQDDVTVVTVARVGQTVTAPVKVIRLAPSEM